MVNTTLIRQEHTKKLANSHTRKKKRRRRREELKKKRNLKKKTLKTRVAKLQSENWGEMQYNKNLF